MVLEILNDVQLDLMLVLSGISAAAAFFMALSKSLDKERKMFLILTNVFSMLLLMSDRTAYMYRGDESYTGFLLVRFSNFMVYAMVLMILWAFNHYVRDIYIDETGIKKIPIRLMAIDYLVLIGMGLLVVSQFTGLYYSFDSANRYQLSPG